MLLDEVVEDAEGFTLEEVVVEVISDCQNWRIEFNQDEVSCVLLLTFTPLLLLMLLFLAVEEDVFPCFSVEDFFVADVLLELLL